jgi:hypothetical protein
MAKGACPSAGNFLSVLTKDIYLPISFGGIFRSNRAQKRSEPIGSRETLTITGVPVPDFEYTFTLGS